MIKYAVFNVYNRDDYSTDLTATDAVTELLSYDGNEHKIIFEDERYVLYIMRKIDPGFVKTLLTADTFEELQDLIFKRQWECRRAMQQDAFAAMLSLDSYVKPTRLLNDVAYLTSVIEDMRVDVAALVERNDPLDRRRAEG